MPSAFEFIQALQVNGRLTFSTAQAVEALGRSEPAVRAQLRRLKEKGDIATPHRGFHVVVPPAYRRLGCLPPEQFVPQLMDHLGEPYYVALLSAAAYHGAAHQAPMTFQVMVPKAQRTIACGGVKVDFVARRDMADTPVVVRNVPTGTIRIASPAATALELVGYPERSGHFDNVATVLSELLETVDGAALAAEARRAPVAWVQRLGYLLELLGNAALAGEIESVLREREPRTVPLVPWKSSEGARYDARWRVAVNSDAEPEA